MFSSAMSPFTPKRSAMARMRSGRKVPSVSMYATLTEDVKHAEGYARRAYTHLAGRPAHVRRQLSNDAHSMSKLGLPSPILAIH